MLDEATAAVDLETDDLIQVIKKMPVSFLENITKPLATSCDILADATIPLSLGHHQVRVQGYNDHHNRAQAQHNH